MTGQDPPQRVDGAGVLTGSLHLGELLPDRVNELASVGMVGQPGHGPGRQARRSMRRLMRKEGVGWCRVGIRRRCAG